MRRIYDCSQRSMRAIALYWSSTTLSPLSFYRLFIQLAGFWPQQYK